MSVAARIGRSALELRPVMIDRGYTEMTPGSVLITMGKTRVLCTVSFDEDVPRWLRDRGGGWVTAEYSMLPGSGTSRVSRNAQQGGRAKEIQRLIGRSLRAVVDMSAMGERTARVDCDVLQADGGTRTAAITGAWVALHDAFSTLVDADELASLPLTDQVAAISVGAFADGVLLDLAYTEDVTADVDCNVVMTGSGGLVEVQGTAEGDPFSRATFEEMLDAAETGIGELLGLQVAALKNSS